MLERIKKNKLFWIVAIVIIAVLIGSIVIVITSRDSKKAGKSNDGSKVEYDGENDEEPDEESGLKVEEDNVTPNVSIDASGSWDDTASDKVDTNENVKEEEQNTTSNKNDNETDEKETTESNVSDGSILEGESWTKPR